MGGAPTAVSAAPPLATKPAAETAAPEGKPLVGGASSSAASWAPWVVAVLVVALVIAGSAYYLHSVNQRHAMEQQEQQQQAYDRIEAESRALEIRYRQQAEEAILQERARSSQQVEEGARGMRIPEREIPGIARRPTEFDNTAFHEKDPGWQIVGSHPEDMESSKADQADQRARMYQRQGGPVPGTMGPREISLGRRQFDEAQDDPNASSI